MVEVDKKVWRKQRPLATGVLDYFGDALMEVAHCSFIGNEQHNPGEPLHWAKEKSQDEPDALLRHLKDRGTIDDDGVRHSAKVAWRALAMLQREIEAERDAAREAAVRRVITGPSRILEYMEAAEPTVEVMDDHHVHHMSGKKMGIVRATD